MWWPPVAEVVFRYNGDGTYDLLIDGRAAEYDVPELDRDNALRRRRVDPGATVVVHDEGTRSLYLRRR
jgi:hypothetical protein